MIVGNGLIAKAFQKTSYSCCDNTIFIAAGVSNSSETKRENFEREYALIDGLTTKYSNKFLVYFSTCSIYQSNHSPYIKHKLAVEEMLKNATRKHLILRLPQVVGPVLNNTLVSSFVKSFVENKTINLFKFAKRYLLGVDDLVRITYILLQHKQELKALQPLNLAPDTSISAEEIAFIVKKMLKSKSKIHPIEKGESYFVDNSLVKKILKSDDPIFKPDYQHAVLKKYIPLICKLINEKLEIGGEKNKYVY